MEYREFVDAIREEVTKKVGEEVNVTIEEMPKCNESYKAGLLIRREKRRLHRLSIWMLFMSITKTEERWKKLRAGSI